MKGWFYMEKGYDRFLGFADTYDEGRPSLPGKAIEILKRYLKNNIDLIVDIGCGTGNSTKVCTQYADKVIGIEPSKDMLSKAQEKENEKLSFKNGFGENTGLENNIADIVICSQAFHWMNPNPTIKEVYRILKKGGIFAVIDADFTPVIDLRLEKIVKELHETIKNIEDENKMILIPQSEHLNNIINSNQFVYCREICFEYEIPYNKNKFKKLILSKSSVQKAIKNNCEPIISKLEELDDVLDEVFKEKDTINALFSYKMKIGIK